MYSTSPGSVRESFEMCGLFSVACTISSVVDFGNRDIASVYLFCFIARRSVSSCCGLLKICYLVALACLLCFVLCEHITHS